MLAEKIEDVENRMTDNSMASIKVQHYSAKQYT